MFSVFLVSKFSKCITDSQCSSSLQKHLAGASVFMCCFTIAAFSKLLIVM